MAEVLCDGATKRVVVAIYTIRNIGRSIRNTLPSNISRNTSMNLGVEACCETMICGSLKLGVLLAMNLCDLPDSVHLELGVFANQVQVPSVAD